MGNLKNTNSSTLNNNGLSYKNFILKNIADIGLFEALKEKTIEINEIMYYINSSDNEMSIIGIILLIAKFEYIFKRKFIKNFYYFKEIDEHPNNSSMIWEINVYENKSIHLSDKQSEILKKLNSKILSNLNYIIIKYKSQINFVRDDEDGRILSDIDFIRNNNETKQKFLFYFNNLIYLLCNIYDLNPDFYKLYFQKEWVLTYISLFKFFIDFNNLPEYVTLLNSGVKSDIHILLLLFSLCMTKDINFKQRINLLSNFPEFLYKVLVTSTYVSGICCCGHNFYTKTYSCQKAIDCIYKLMNYVENNQMKNINNLLSEEKRLKIKFTDLLFKKRGKNVCMVYLNKMAEICSNDDIFEYLFVKTNLFKECLFKINENYENQHDIQNLLHFITICENPKLLMNLVNSVNSEQIYKHNKLYFEIIKKVKGNKKSKNLIYEGNSLENIMNLLSAAAENSSYIIEIEGVFEIILNVEENDEDLLEIFYKNYFTFVKYINRIIDNFIKNKLYGICMDTAIRIMIKFILIGEKIKKEYDCKNPYIEEFRNIYKKIEFLKSDDALELKEYFKE